MNCLRNGLAYLTMYKLSRHKNKNNWDFIVNIIFSVMYCTLLQSTTPSSASYAISSLLCLHNMLYGDIHSTAENVKVSINI